MCLTCKYDLLRFLYFFLALFAFHLVQYLVYLFQSKHYLFPTIADFITVVLFFIICIIRSLLFSVFSICWVVFFAHSSSPTPNKGCHILLSFLLILLFKLYSFIFSIGTDLIYPVTYHTFFHIPFFPLTNVPCNVLKLWQFLGLYPTTLIKYVI